MIVCQVGYYSLIKGLGEAVFSMRYLNFHAFNWQVYDRVYINPESAAFFLLLKTLILMAKTTT